MLKFQDDYTTLIAAFDVPSPQAILNGHMLLRSQGTCEQ